MLFGPKYKIVKAPHIKVEDVGENESKWDWSHEVYIQHYLLFIPLGWVYKDKFQERIDAQHYIEYQLNPLYYS